MESNTLIAKFMDLEYAPEGSRWDDWFDIDGTSIDQTNLDGSTLAFHANFTGNFVWVRAKVSGMTAGAVSKILYNH